MGFSVDFDYIKKTSGVNIVVSSWERESLKEISILKNVKIHAEKRIRQIALEKIQQNQ